MGVAGEMKMAAEIESLAYYVFRARKAGVPKESFSADGDYHDQIPEMVDLAAAESLWHEMHDADNELVPLSDIDIPQVDFLDIAEQIFNGVHYGKVVLSLPPAPLR